MRSPNWTDYIFNVRLQIPNNGHVLQSHHFLVNFLILLWSGVLLASATIERFLSIAFTFQVKCLEFIPKLLMRLVIVYTRYNSHISLASIFAYFTDATKFGKEIDVFQ